MQINGRKNNGTTTIVLSCLIIYCPINDFKGHHKTLQVKQYKDWIQQILGQNNKSHFISNQKFAIQRVIEMIYNITKIELYHNC